MTFEQLTFTLLILVVIGTVAAMVVGAYFTGHSHGLETAKEFLLYIEGGKQPPWKDGSDAH